MIRASSGLWLAHPSDSPILRFADAEARCPVISLPSQNSSFSESVQKGLAFSDRRKKESQETSPVPGGNSPQPSRGSSPVPSDSRSSSAPLLHSPSTTTPLLGSDGKELPDLTDQLAERGLLKEYLKFRAGYNNWRQGKSKGAKGEFTHEGLELEKRRAEGLEPDEQEWRWRHTVIYWVCVFYLEGSICFVVACCAGCFPDSLPDMFFAMNTELFFFGAMCYSACNYLMIFEIMNLNTPDAKHFRWNPFAVSSHIQHSKDIGLNIMPFVAIFNSFIGASCYQVSMFIDLFPSVLENPKANFWISQMPTAVGGTLFLTSSICEIVEWSTEKDSNSVGTVVFFSTIGSILFSIAGWIYMVPPTPSFDSEWIGNLMFLVGSVSYSLCAVLDLIMWRNGNFGLGFSAQLAKIAKGSQEQERLSTFSIMIVAILCLFAVLSGTACCLEAVAVRWSSPTDLNSFARILYPAIVFVLIHMAVAYRSAVLHVPKVQPWRALHSAGHLVVVLACMLVIAQIADCIMEQQSHATSAQ